jgi:hypothetical protein
LRDVFQRNWNFKTGYQYVYILLRRMHLTDLKYNCDDNNPKKQEVFVNSLKDVELFRSPCVDFIKYLQAVSPFIHWCTGSQLLLTQSSIQTPKHHETKAANKHCMIHITFWISVRSFIQNRIHPNDNQNIQWGFLLACVFT